jgi:hypothetical protein
VCVDEGEEAGLELAPRRTAAGEEEGSEVGGASLGGVAVEQGLDRGGAAEPEDLRLVEGSLERSLSTTPARSSRVRAGVVTGIACSVVVSSGARAAQ